MNGVSAASSCVVLRDALGDQLFEVLAIDAGRILAFEELLLDLRSRLLRELPLIQRLHGQLARDGRARVPRAPLTDGFPG